MKKFSLWLILSIVLTLCVSERAIGDDYKVIPSFIVKGEYNDNILYSSGDTKRDFISTFSPGLAFMEKTERLDLTLSGRLESRVYASHSEINATDQYYEGAGRYALTPRFSVSGKALYSDDSRPDRDLDISGLALTNVQRRRQNYTASADYALSEKTLASFAYDYQNDAYDAAQYSDLEAHTLNLSFLHDLSYFARSTKVQSNFAYAAYRFPGVMIESGEATVGIVREINEKWAITVNGGARYTESRFKTYTPQTYIQGYLFDIFPVFGTRVIEEDDRSRGWGGVGRLALNYKGQNSNGELSAARNVSPASGRSGASERTSFVFSASRKLTYEFSATLSGGYYANRSSAGEFSRDRIDEDTVRVSPGIRYDFNRDMALEAAYSYYRTKYNSTNIEAERNIFQLMFNIQHNLLD